MASVQQFLGALFRDALSAWRSLSGTALVTGFAGTATVLFLADTFRAWYRLSHVPGPFWAAISKFWMVRQSLKGQQPYAIQELNEKYGEYGASLVPCGIVSLTLGLRIARTHRPK